MPRKTKRKVEAYGRELSRKRKGQDSVRQHSYNPSDLAQKAEPRGLGRKNASSRPRKTLWSCGSVVKHP